MKTTYYVLKTNSTPEAPYEVFSRTEQNRIFLVNGTGRKFSTSEEAEQLISQLTNIPQIERTYLHLDGYLNSLIEDVYPQPQDEGHTAWAFEAFDAIISPHTDIQTVLDVGCGEAFMQEWFTKIGAKYTGITLGKEDIVKAKELGRNVLEMDFSFLDFPDSSFDLILSRHSLEHSPMPLLTLMEWHRVSKKYLLLINPTPTGFGWAGRNHYSVMNSEQLEFLLDRANFRLLFREETEQEYRYMCVKKGK